MIIRDKYLFFKTKKYFMPILQMRISFLYNTVLLNECKNYETVLIIYKRQNNQKYMYDIFYNNSISHTCIFMQR
ncbi:hypothetical protein PFAG_00962 [Plasmodium falciparum Santa Lucia]|uniref:Uncharacterized protein n=5 Tax=Plasmodium falciparum TaxID=5833 RepID=A0A024WUM4_PLAFA|nr:hypothetical protein PFFVO_01008 [Plasmodium falciparum Vietnam Oak-Knoll (FVO)]ETW44534.1 hypothetical protein PFNF135_01102 [Plasmodium falciparum NF135/5.C10]ETW50914.1 hypothetical protein PFMALIP_01073 [Plasmodium falciparum MaliPS096_E11]EUT90605.1 hypothetical protein PFAG_00962 [Plasmodium falciparum Santa Lucia]EWC78232.1 hypothetical protein C923_01091 [Plasmodium falciparum UGT5.1]